MFFNVLFKSTFITYNLNGAVAQLARAPALQAGGQEFDSPQLHQTDKTIKSQLNKLEIINNTKFRIFKKAH